MANLVNKWEFQSVHLYNDYSEAVLGDAFPWEDILKAIFYHGAPDLPSDVQEQFAQTYIFDENGKQIDGETHSYDDCLTSQEISDRVTDFYLNSATEPSLTSRTMIWTRGGPVIVLKFKAK